MGTVPFVLACALVTAGCLAPPTIPPKSTGVRDGSTGDLGLDGAGAHDVEADADVVGELDMSAALDAAVAPPDAEPPDVAPDALVLAANGNACSAGSACASGFCVNGLCCNSACTVACQACDVAGSLGTCSPVPDGQDPGNSCEAEAVATCGRDGLCDGKGACRRQAAGTSCAPGSCTDGREQAASTCDGNGQCVAGAGQMCASGVCQGASCGAPCTADADCQSGFFCDQGACHARRPIAQACTADDQCNSGHCIDGVCCGTACAQTCYACNLTNTPGVCTAVPDGADPHNQCAAEAPPSCGRMGGCNGRGACRVRASGTVCMSASCSGTSATTAGTCDGVGNCQAGVAQDCGAYTCNGDACRTTCASSDQCKVGFTCDGTACMPAAKIALLTVHDTTNAASWAVMSDFEVGMMGAHPFTDYPNTYVAAVDAMAMHLVGKPWIKVASASKNYAGGPQATIQLAAAATVYIAVDDRWGATPAWTTGWTDTGFNVTVWESAMHPALAFSLYQLMAPAGSVDLPAIKSNMAYDYFIIVE